jgi:hypothetical protein
MPEIVKALQDRSVLTMTAVAMRALGQLISATGDVVAPYAKYVLIYIYICVYCVHTHTHIHEKETTQKKKKCANSCLISSLIFSSEVSLYYDID